MINIDKEKKLNGIAHETMVEGISKNVVVNDMRITWLPLRKIFASMLQFVVSTTIIGCIAWGVSYGVTQLIGYLM